MELTSTKNPLIQRVRKAIRQGALTEDGFAVAEGPHLYEEAKRAECEIGWVLVSETAAKRLSVSDDITIVADAVMSDLSSTETTQGVIALVRPPQHSLEKMFAGTALVVVLDGVQDPGNAGAILRAAEAFGATGAVFLKGSVNPYNPKCLRASAGSVFRLPLVAGVETIPSITLYAAMPRAAKRIDEVDLTLPCALVIGSEGRGVSDALAGRAIPVNIPTQGVESLNAAVAAGILLYEARRQRTRI